MQPLHTEGIILHVIDYKEHDKILTVFSSSHGLIKTYVRKSSSKDKSPLEPLVLADFILMPGKSDLLQCREVSVQNRYLALREQYPRLEAACDLIKAIQESQFLFKPALPLYQLLVYLLDKLDRAPHPYALAAGFRLKILRHDGLFTLGSGCAICQNAPSGMHYLLGGETYCQAHAPAYSQAFLGEEIHCMQILTSCQTFGELSSQVVERPLFDKIKYFFHSSLQNQV